MEERPKTGAPCTSGPGILSVPDVVVSRRAADRIASGHPWIFAGDVVTRAGIPAGAVVRVVDQQRNCLGTAHYSATSQITLRLLSRHAEQVDTAFFLSRLERAQAYRRQVVSGANAYRIVHGEADGLPALIVDRYGDYLVLQTLDQGMDAAKNQVVEALGRLVSPAGIVERNSARVRAHERLPLVNSLLRGEAPDVLEVEMNGLRWRVHLLTGQKTGLYLDQRENYVALQRFAHGPALDCFTYSGGFALHLAGVCSRVEAVDSSAEAVEMGRQNARRNEIGNVEFRQADVLDLLAEYASARRKFSTIVLDPPAFAKSRAQIPGALRGYKEINLRALRMLGRDGILASCSCSHHVSEADLLQIIAGAALDAGRTLRVLERRTQALDHPVLLTVPETHYLKCLFFQVA